MDLVLPRGARDDVVAAARLAAARAGLDRDPRASPDRGPWWRVGLDDAVERAPVESDARRAYDAAPSPRSTRGATRA